MSKPKIPNQKKKYQELNNRLNRYVALVEQIYDTLNLEAAKAVLRTDYSADSDKPFKWSDYPQTRKQIADIQMQFVDDIHSVIYRGTSEEWKNSNEVQDLIADKVLQAYDAIVDKKKYTVLYQTNSDALKAFQSRKDKGFNISDKLWNQSTIYKEELEAAISCAIQKGTSAVTLSKQISKYLLDFPSLQKDYKEKYGSAKHLKDCEYRSIRLARSEINMAYRTAENERWKQMDFVVGYEIKLSSSHHHRMPHGDICDMLAGRYPKDFVWTGWHPNDLCYKIPILKTEEEFWEWDGRSDVSTESVNEVKDVPNAFKQWVGANAYRIEEAKKRGTLPYFVRDNQKRIDSILDYTPTSTFTVYKIEGMEQLSVLDGSNYELTKAVSDVESNIRQNKSHETGVLFNKDGNIVINKRGGSRSVQFTKDECLLMNDGIFTHNHPGAWGYSENDIMRIGNSFSIQDIALAVGNNLAEMRAVTPNYTFSMKRPDGGWGISVEELMKLYNDENRNLRLEFTRRINKDTLTISQASATHFHILWKRLSKKLGFDYSKMKTK
nr:MAG TPA: minor capsid protein [Caudoviricetes sp.]